MIIPYFTFLEFDPEMYTEEFTNLQRNLTAKFNSKTNSSKFTDKLIMLLEELESYLVLSMRKP